MDNDTSVIILKASDPTEPPVGDDPVQGDKTGEPGDKTGEPDQSETDQSNTGTEDKKVSSIYLFVCLMRNAAV